MGDQAALTCTPERLNSAAAASSRGRGKRVWKPYSQPTAVVEFNPFLCVSQLPPVAALSSSTEKQGGTLWPDQTTQTWEEKKQHYSWRQKFVTVETGQLVSWFPRSPTIQPWVRHLGRNAWGLVSPSWPPMRLLANNTIANSSLDASQNKLIGSFFQPCPQPKAVEDICFFFFLSLVETNAGKSQTQWNCASQSEATLWQGPAKFP